MAPGVYHAPYANPYRCPIGARDAAGCTRECLAYIENQILTHLVSPDEVAAIVFEPIQGEGGYIVPPPEFLQGLAAIAAQHGMLLIADEVQSGIGRTGKMFAVEHAGVQPDIVVAAKGIASGLPMGVTIAREDVMDWPVGRAFEYVRRQSGGVRGGARDDQAGARRPDAERRRRRGSSCAANSRSSPSGIGSSATCAGAA